MSLVLFIASGVSYLRTRTAIEWIEYATPQRSYRVVGRPVGVFLSTTRFTQPQTGLSVHRMRQVMVDFPGYRRLFGFSIGRIDSNVGMVDYVLMPYWFVTVASAVLPALWTSLWMQRRHARLAGLCRKCGYDLRASRERCPECGTPIPAHAIDPLPAA